MLKLCNESTAIFINLFIFLMRFSFIVTYILNKIKTHRITMLNWEEYICLCVCVFGFSVFYEMKNFNARKTRSELLK